jgi:predicted extracellular nuclease
MKKLSFLLIIVLLTGFKFSFAKGQDTILVGFWNMENFYDTLRDKRISDEEFLPDSKKHWTSERYITKCKHHAQVILEMNSGKGLDILGMSEIENRGVVEDLIKQMPECNYGIAHIDSPDERGIDCALIFKSGVFNLVSVVGDTVVLPDKHPTRLILHVVLQNKKSNELLNVFVNHWPSRRGGSDESQINRITAAQVLRKDVDAVLAKNKDANIVIMGDFNDEPTNVSIDSVLAAGHYSSASRDAKKTLQNLAWERKSKGEGTLKYRNEWDLLDQIIVSNPMVEKSNISYLNGSFTIYKRDYMIETEEKYAGSPLPTYGGNKYLGGYSDHFPVFAKFIVRIK